MNSQERYPAAQSAGARLLLSKCSACHVAPLPRQHRAREWPAIVQRMQRRRMSKGLEAITDGEMLLLEAYLQRYAGSAR